MRKTMLLIAFGLTTFAAATAEAKQYRYLGAHPLSAEVYCYIEAPHVHVVPPYKKVLFRERDDSYFFVGDPVAYGYEGDRHVYHGHHPIQTEVVIGRPGHEFCYLDGPHYHAWAPPPTARFEVRGGVHWYVGKMPKRYRREVEIYGGINTVHAEVRYTRPVVTIEPPPSYVELHVGGPHLRVAAVAPAPHVRAHVVAPAPHVRVVAPAPHVRHSVGVGVAVPRHSVSVGVVAPAPVVRHETRVVVQGKHDNGRHLGQRKHGKKRR
jgi:hypothetical protein